MVVKQRSTTLTSIYESQTSSDILSNTDESVSLYVGLGFIVVIVIVALSLYVFYVKVSHEENKVERLRKRQQKTQAAKTIVKKTNSNRLNKKKQFGEKRKKSIFSMFQRPKGKRKKSKKKKERITFSSLDAADADIGYANKNTSLQKLKELELMDVKDSTNVHIEQPVTNPMMAGKSP